MRGLSKCRTYIPLSLSSLKISAARAFGCVANMKLLAESAKENPSAASSPFAHSLVSITFFLVSSK